jgi:hypothetical protein
MVILYTLKGEFSMKEIDKELKSILIKLKDLTEAIVNNNNNIKKGEQHELR